MLTYVYPPIIFSPPSARFAAPKFLHLVASKCRWHGHTCLHILFDCEYRYWEFAGCECHHRTCCKFWELVHLESVCRTVETGDAMFAAASAPETISPDNKIHAHSIEASWADVHFGYLLLIDRIALSSIDHMHTYRTGCLVGKAWINTRGRQKKCRMINLRKKTCANVKDIALAFVTSMITIYEIWRNLQNFVNVVFTVRSIKLLVHVYSTKLSLHLFAIYLNIPWAQHVFASKTPGPEWQTAAKLNIVIYFQAGW